MKVLKWILLFLVINFGALFIGSLLMNNGPQTDWYTNLKQAPWTPPGWVFGVTWTSIMICFSIYMADLVIEKGFKHIAVAFGLQFVLNVIWNYIFFNIHLTGLALLVIIFLTFVVFYFFYYYLNIEKLKSFLILPYLVWLIIATSLNFYIVIYN